MVWKLATPYELMHTSPALVLAFPVYLEPKIVNVMSTQTILLTTVGTKQWLEAGLQTGV